MIKNNIKIRKLENFWKLEKLQEGEVVIISIGSGKIYDNKEYYGPVVFIGERLKGSKLHGLDFCRPQANCEDCLIGYHIPLNKIFVFNGAIHSREFSTYGCKTQLIKNSGLF